MGESPPAPLLLEQPHDQLIPVAETARPGVGVAQNAPQCRLRQGPLKRESSLLTTYWSGFTDVFGVPASRHGSLNPLFQVALYLPS